jgi:hypothetical protein
MADHIDKKRSVPLHLSLPKPVAVSLWRLCAQRKITIERCLEELLDREKAREAVEANRGGRPI